jgi:CHAT domain-containing protein/Tfp pilus assembly protein PilF
MINSSFRGQSGDQRDMKGTGATASRLREMTDSLSGFMEGRLRGVDPERLTVGIELILAQNTITDTLLLSDAFYFTGIQYFYANRYSKAYDFFSVSSRYRERLALYDRRYANSLSNMATTLLRLGDYPGAYSQGLKALQAKRNVSDTDSSLVANNYLNLASTYLELNDNLKALSMAEAGLAIVRLYPASATPKLKADLYQVIGLSLYRSQEYNKSLVYCREALRLYEEEPVISAGSMILIYNTLGQVYRRLGMPEEAERHFRKGLTIDSDLNTQDKFLLYINYASFLSQEGRVNEGEKILRAGLENVKSIYGQGSRDYYLMLVSVADFVNNDLGDSERSVALYNECFGYVHRNPWDISMTKFIAGKYVRALLATGRYTDVLNVTSEMDSLSYTLSDNPGRDNTGYVSILSPEGVSEDDIILLRIRYEALNALAVKDGNPDYVRQAVSTGRRLVSLYDRRRLEMSEDESRTTLSSSSRDIYTGIIDNYASLYQASHDRGMLKDLFEFTERSKVAGFLASMRELNAARFSLPPDLSDLDSEIRKEAGFYRELIAKEQIKAAPDSQKLATWESVTFRLQRSRDSLVRIFEEQYPAYYNLKFRNEVAGINDINRIIGVKANLLSYVLTEDKLYIFVANRRRSELITRDIDSTFFSSLQRFRGMLSAMPRTSGSRAPFNEYMDLAHSLYRILIEPAEPYLTGDKIVISPDNILSYLPFETLVSEEFRSPDLLYREAPFALKKYRFSYIYSVTLSSEATHRSRRINNRLVAFAPTYEGMEIADSMLTAWPSLRGEIRDLPYAILEAEDAVSQCNGMGYIGEEAKEKVFKDEAPRFDIIHMAMHTLVDDRNPAFSKMLFTGSQEGSNDGMLNTYEVYSIPLNAMMVVLSSCNTGSGMLVTGEGILSLARGFLYAGSRSAVMSMWEVEDVSASEVIHSFYKNMRSGQTKSSALRNARLRFLRTADQGRSHPYYWAALVIYGDDTSLWYNRVNLYVALLLFLLAATLLLALIYKGPRS